MNPEDIDTGISSLVAGLVPEGIVRDAVAAQFQELQDVAVKDALVDHDAELADRNLKIEQLSTALSASAKKVAQLHAAHIKKITLLHQTETAIASVLESKNPVVRWAAKRMRVVNGFDERQLDFQIAFDALAERDLQDEKWGRGRHMPNGTGSRANIAAMKAAQADTDLSFAKGTGTWLHILKEEFFEVAAETNPKHLKEELRQVVAVCNAWMVDLLTQTPKTEKPRRTKSIREFKALVDNRLVKE